ncbi:MAG: carboxypeptidase regulatory-like domain-containing protein [Nitrospirae bacterium]|nr:carboxypeptidase regulatory-like domain-containing protein [Nitrospirota bacterium]
MATVTVTLTCPRGHRALLPAIGLAAALAGGCATGRAARMEAAPAIEMSQASTIVVTVVEPGSENPMSGVDVIIRGPRDFVRTTDEYGELTLDSMPAGEYAVAVSIDGFLPMAKRVAVGPSQFREVVIQPVRPAQPSVYRSLPSTQPLPIEADAASVVLFGQGTTAIKSSALPILDEVSHRCQEQPALVLGVIGEAPRAGGASDLALKRAIVVADYLAMQGVDRKRIVPMAARSGRAQEPLQLRSGARGSDRVVIRGLPLAAEAGL